jgi:hypothetical protein
LFFRHDEGEGEVSHWCRGVVVVVSFVV